VLARRSAGGILAGGVLAGGVLLADIAPAATWLPVVRHHLTPSLAGLGRPDHLALTFDDGPDPLGTPAVLATLAGLGWTATFFMLGRMAERFPALARAVARGGHEIAVHGYDHRYLPARGLRGARDDVARGVAAVERAAGVRPRWYRPPYGVLTTSGILAARANGLRPVLWSAWGEDWTTHATPGSVVRELTRGRLAGGTALLHDSDLTSAAGSWQVTVSALPLLADELARRGLAVGPLREHGLPAGRADRGA
jgi:peptidoglycan/xylan/chitin deacetylase (PgdA/CDA1 family)